MSEDDVRYDIWDVRMLGKSAFLTCQISLYVLVSSILAKSLITFFPGTQTTSERFAVDIDWRYKKMSKVCQICGKGPQTGHNVSHANNKTKRRWYPNLQRVRTVQNGVVRYIKICTRCLRSGKVLKPA